MVSRYLRCIKGGLISESVFFFTFAHSPECYLLEKSDFALFLEIWAKVKNFLRLSHLYCRKKYSRKENTSINWSINVAKFRKAFPIWFHLQKNGQNHRLSTFHVRLKSWWTEISCIFLKMGPKIRIPMYIKLCSHL